MNNHDDANPAEARRCFDSRLENVRAALADAERQNVLMQDCLSIEARIAIDIQLSTGGPGDGFKIICDATTGQPLHGCHYFVNWGFRKEVPLLPDELADVCAAYALEDGRTFLPASPR